MYFGLNLNITWLSYPFYIQRLLSLKNKVIYEENIAVWFVCDYSAFLRMEGTNGFYCIDKGFFFFFFFFFFLLLFFFFLFLFLLLFFFFVFFFFLLLLILFFLFLLSDLVFQVLPLHIPIPLLPCSFSSSSCPFLFFFLLLFFLFLFLVAERL